MAAMSVCALLLLAPEIRAAMTVAAAFGEASQWAAKSVPEAGDELWESNGMWMKQ